MVNSFCYYALTLNMHYPIYLDYIGELTYLLKVCLGRCFHSCLIISLFTLTTNAAITKKRLVFVHIFSFKLVSNMHC